MYEALRFLNIAVRYEDGIDSLYNRASTELLSGTELPDWEYRVNLIDVAELDPDRQPGSQIHYEANVGIYFPHEDLETLFERFEDYNSKAPHCPHGIANSEQ